MRFGLASLRLSVLSNARVQTATSANIGVVQRQNRRSSDCQAQ